METVADIMAQDLNRALEARALAARALDVFLLPMCRLRDQRGSLERRMAQGVEDAGKVGRSLPDVLVMAVEERLCALDAEIQALDLAAAPLRAALREAEADYEVAAAAFYVSEAL